MEEGQSSVQLRVASQLANGGAGRGRRDALTGRRSFVSSWIRPRLPNWGLFAPS